MILLGVKRRPFNLHSQDNPFCLTLFMGTTLAGNEQIDVVC